MSTEKNQSGDIGVRDALKNACDRLQSFLDTFGDLGDCVTDADLNDWRSALSAEKRASYPRSEALPPVEMIQMMAIFSEPADPMWRVHVSSYCIDFETETAANNVRNAISALAAPPLAVPRCDWEAIQDAHDHLKEGIAKTNVPTEIYKAMHALTYALRSRDEPPSARDEPLQKIFNLIEADEFEPNILIGMIKGHAKHGLSLLRTELLVNKDRVQEIIAELGKDEPNKFLQWENDSWRTYYAGFDLTEFAMDVIAALLRAEPKYVRDKAIEALRAWHKLQSMENTSTLYNIGSELFNSKFDPREYDDVE